MSCSKNHMIVSIIWKKEENIETIMQIWDQKFKKLIIWRNLKIVDKIAWLFVVIVDIL